MTRRPVIGLCAAVERARWSAWDQEAVLLPRGYAQAVQRAGGMAVVGLGAVMIVEAVVTTSAVVVLF